MPVRTRTRRRPHGDIPERVIAALCSGDFRSADNFDLDVFELWGNDTEQRAVWRAVRARVLADWIQRTPGTRPWIWWEVDGPKWRLEHMPKRIAHSSALWVGRLCEPRRRLGGIGTPEYEVLNTWPSLPFGLPSVFVAAWAVDPTTGGAADVHGERIGTKYHEGHFSGLAIDPGIRRATNHRPRTRRHGLMDAAERKRLPAEAFEPEIVRLGGVA